MVGLICNLATRGVSSITPFLAQHCLESWRWGQYGQGKVLFSALLPWEGSWILVPREHQTIGWLDSCLIAVMGAPTVWRPSSGLHWSWDAEIARGWCRLLRTPRKHVQHHPMYKFEPLLITVCNAIYTGASWANRDMSRICMTTPLDSATSLISSMI